MFMCTQAGTQTEAYMQTYTCTRERTCCTRTETKNTQRLTQNMDHKGQHVGDEPFMFWDKSPAEAGRAELRAKYRMFD